MAGRSAVRFFQRDGSDRRVCHEPCVVYFFSGGAASGVVVLAVSVQLDHDLYLLGVQSVGDPLADGGLFFAGTDAAQLHFPVYCVPVLRAVPAAGPCHPDAGLRYPASGTGHSGTCGRAEHPGAVASGKSAGGRDGGSGLSDILPLQQCDQRHGGRRRQPPERNAPVVLGGSSKLTALLFGLFRAGSGGLPGSGIPGSETKSVVLHGVCVAVADPAFPRRTVKRFLYARFDTGCFPADGVLRRGTAEAFG